MIDEVFETNLKLTAAKAVSKRQTDMSDFSDEKLVKLAISGSEAAFAVIFERYRRLVVHLVARFFSQKEEIEDLTQQSFAKIYFSLKSFRGGHQKSFTAWVSRLTINTCYDELRRHQNERIFCEFSDAENDILNHIMETGPTDAENLLVAKDLAEKVLAGLEIEERLALTLIYGENYSVADVAQIVGWSKSKVKIRLFRCRNKLKSRFKHLF